MVVKRAKSGKGNKSEEEYKVHIRFKNKSFDEMEDLFVVRGLFFPKEKSKLKDVNKK